MTNIRYEFDGCKGPKPKTHTDPPPNLPQEEVFLGQTTFLASPIAVQGEFTSNTSSDIVASQCPASRACRTPCGRRCRARRGPAAQFQCCRPVGGRGQRVYCPRRGNFCNWEIICRKINIWNRPFLPRKSRWLECSDWLLLNICMYFLVYAYKLPFIQAI